MPRRLACRDEHCAELGLVVAAITWLPVNETAASSQMTRASIRSCAVKVTESSISPISERPIGAYESEAIQ